MNMFSEAVRKKTEEAARQIRTDYERTQAILAKDVADQLIHYLVEHPALQNIDIGFQNNVVTLTKTLTKRVLQIICSGVDAFSLVEKVPGFQGLVTEIQPPITKGRTIPLVQMTSEVTSWLAA
jgi:hypothetical protein